MVDSDKQYIDSFSEYVKFLECPEYTMNFFSDISVLEQYSDSCNVDVIIIAQHLITQCEKISICHVSDKKFMVLAEESDVESIGGIKAVYRYQPVDLLINDILNYCADMLISQETMSRYVRKNMTKVVSIYSPVGRCGKTKLSVETGVELTRREWRVLLINFEEFSALMKYIGEGADSDLSDLLYFYLNGNGTIGIKAQTVIRNYRGMDYIPPVTCIRDLRKTDSEKLLDLVSMLGSIRGYDVILMDLSNIVEDVFRMLEASDMVIVPGLEDEISLTRLKSFREYIANTDYDISFDNIYELNMEETDLKHFSDNRDLMEIMKELEERLR